MGKGNSIVPAEVASDGQPHPLEVPVRPLWIGIGLALALIARMLSSSRPGRTPDLWILAFLFPAFAILTFWAYAADTGPAPWLRVPRAALFAFLAIQVFYWGIGIGGFAAAAGAYSIFTRFIRPRKRSSPE